MKDYCKDHDNDFKARPIRVKCSICGKEFVSTHKPPDTVCEDCTQKMKRDDVFRCRVCQSNIDSAASDNEEFEEVKDMSRAYRREMEKEKKKRNLKMNSYASNGKMGKNGKYIRDGELDESTRLQKMTSRKNSRHSDKQNINRGLREGFTEDDFDDVIGGKIKFKKNKGFSNYR